MTVWVELDHHRRYPIYIGNKTLDTIYTLPLFQKRRAKIAIFTHPEVVTYAQVVCRALTDHGHNVSLITVPSGENQKTLQTVESMLDHLMTQAFERQDVVVAVGGGVIGDMAGFLASIALRGLAFVQIPTTLLAQVDAAIGGKTGVNHTAGKNLIGSFYQPHAVWIDMEPLQTLPKRELLCGLAEIIKYGIIRDADLFSTIESSAKTISELDPVQHSDLWQHLIIRSCINKAEVVAQDEKEAGLRETLNFGHTIGHGIETVFDYSRYLHGEAVALGMAAACQIALTKNLLDSATFNRILNLLKNVGFCLKLAPCDLHQIYQILTHDKKVRDHRIRFVLPTGIGHTLIGQPIEEPTILGALHFLMEQSGS